MNMRRFLTSASLVATVLALAACNSSSSNSGGPVGPCTLPSPFQVIYPIPATTGVPDNPQTLVFATNTGGSLSGWNAFLNNVNSLNGAGQTIATAQEITAGQVPSPAAKPTFANPQYWSITLATGFNPGNTIYVWMNNLNSTCNPTGPVSSFTVQ
jgi:hypothetical protein